MRSPGIECAERHHGKGRLGHGPENSGKNRRGGRNPRAKNAGPVRGRRLFSVSELVEVVGVEIGLAVSEKL